MKHSLRRPRNCSRDAQLMGFPRLFESRPMRETHRIANSSMRRIFPSLRGETRIAIGKAKKASRLASSSHRIPDDHGTTKRPILNGLHHEYRLERIAA